MGFIFWQTLPSISLYVWLYIYIYIYINIYNIYIIYIYIIYIYIYIYIHTTNIWEILLLSLDLIKHVHEVINLLYSKHWTDKWKYIPYISVTHQVLKPCRSKISTLEHDVYDAHGASSLYKKPVGKFIQSFPYWEDGEVPPPTKNLLIHCLPTKLLFPPTKSQVNPIKK